MYTLDTNILIYYIQDDAAVTNYIAELLPSRRSLIIPTIVIVEFLCYPLIGIVERKKFEAVLEYCHVMDLTHDIALKAADLRAAYRLSLGDSVIAASKVVWFV